MATLVCLPLTQEYIDISDRVIEEIKNPKAKPLRADIERAADLLIAAILEVLVIKMLETVEMKPLAKTVVTQLGHLIEKVAAVLVNKVIAKMSNQEVRPLVEYLNNMECEIEGNRYLSFELGTTTVKFLMAGYQALDAGKTHEARANLISALTESLNEGTIIFYKKPMELLKLGFVARKVVDLGYTSLDKAIRPAIHKIGEHMELEELKSLKVYIDNLVIETE